MVWCPTLPNGPSSINNGVGNVWYVEIGSCCSGCNGASPYKVMMIEPYGALLFRLLRRRQISDIVSMFLMPCIDLTARTSALSLLVLIIITNRLSGVLSIVIL